MNTRLVKLDTCLCGRQTPHDARRLALALQTDCASRIPKEILANLAALLPQLDGPSYALRSAVVTTLGNIVAHAFPAGAGAGAAAGSGDADADAAPTPSSSTATRDALLDVMQERVRDVHAFTRAAVLRAWLQLLHSDALPVERFHAVAAIVIDRLHDKSAIARKAALQVVTALVEKNPYGRNLSPEVFAQQLEVEDAWLAANVERIKLLEEAGEAMLSRGRRSRPSGGKKKKAARRGGRGRDDDDGDDDGDASDAGGDGDGEADGEVDGGDGGDAPMTVDVDEEEVRHMNIRGYCIVAHRFAEQMSSAVPVISQLMGSKNISDVVEAIRFMARARTYNLPGVCACASRSTACCCVTAA